MRKFILLMVMVSPIYANTALRFHDNGNLEVRLSQTNYNRLVVKDDKITEVHFPENAMAAKGDDDGSLYVIAREGIPFTLFVTTEGGHHFSATVTSEESLGQTLEFIPIRDNKGSASYQKKATVPALYTPLIEAMMKDRMPVGYQLKHHFGKTIQMQQGLVLVPQKTYEGVQFNGEVLELYNGSSEPIQLKEPWFATPDVKAVSLSVRQLAPKGRAFVYRVVGHHHG